MRRAILNEQAIYVIENYQKSPKKETFKIHNVLDIFHYVREGMGCCNLFSRPPLEVISLEFVCVIPSIFLPKIGCHSMHACL